MKFVSMKYRVIALFRRIPPRSPTVASSILMAAEMTAKCRTDIARILCGAWMIHLGAQSAAAVFSWRDVLRPPAVNIR